jgi:hypothetical protein
MRKVLYRNFHEVEGQVYLVEIARTKIKVSIMLFPNFEHPETFMSCILAEKQAQLLMS